MEITHTPGPWMYLPRGTEGHYEIGLENEIPQCIGVRGSEYMAVSGICKEADASLMAAAPELLAAAVEFMRGEGNTKQVRDMFRAAIAKATGATATEAA